VQLETSASSAGCISIMDCSHWEPHGVSKRVWSVNLHVTISGEYETLGGDSGQPLE